MKAKLFLGMAAAALLALTACDNSSKLADNVVGTWVGTPTQMTKPHKEGKGHKDDGAKPDKAMAQVTCTPILTFTKTDGTNGGDITIEGNYTIDQQLQSAALAVPLKATISGAAKAQGTWKATDDDDIEVTIDSSLTEVAMDTASVNVQFAQLTDIPADQLIPIKEMISENVASTATDIIKARIAKVKKLDDVKIVDNTLKLELGHTDLTLTKQQ